MQSSTPAALNVRNFIRESTIIPACRASASSNAVTPCSNKGCSVCQKAMFAASRHLSQRPL